MPCRPYGAAERIGGTVGYKHVAPTELAPAETEDGGSASLSCKLVGLIVNGASVDDVLRSFPDLTRAQVYECLAFYEDHRTEIDALVAEQMAEPGV
jgi:Protein of unknown function (DUF433)